MKDTANATETITPEQQVDAIRAALAAGRKLWLRTYAGAWGVREIKLASNGRESLVKLGRQRCWTWLLRDQLDFLYRQAVAA